MSAGGSIGMVLDRALNLDLLEVSLRVATEHRDATDSRHLLSVALRDFVTAQEANNKTRKILTHVWVAPPAPAAEMIRWAIDHQHAFVDRRALHYGALLATFPFVGSVASAVGRQIHVDGAADRKTLRTFARAKFGEREFIDAGASKSLATMRNLGLLEGPSSGPYRVGEQHRVPSSFSSWFLHALILTRQAESARVAELSRAFELVGIEVEPTTSPYPMLELHAENGSTVAVAHDAGV